MLVYLVNLFSVPIWSFLLKTLFKMNKVDQKVVTLVCIQTIFIMGFRGIEIGVDTRLYSWIFDNCGNLSFFGLFGYYVEIGYSLLNKLIFVLFGEYRVLLFANAVIIMWGIRRLILNLSTNKVMSIYLFIAMGYFCSAMNIMRQYVALVFVLNAFIAILSKQKVWKILSNCLIATLFHSSAFLMIIVVIGYYIIYSGKIKEEGTIRFIAFVACLVLMLFIDELISRLPFLDYDYLENAGGYKYDILNFNFLLKIIFIVFYWHILKYGKNTMDDKELEILRFCNYLMIISCLINVGSIAINMFTRVNLYFSIMLIIFIPNLLKKLPIKEKGIVNLVVYIGGAVIFFLDLTENANYVPYVFLSGG